MTRAQTPYERALIQELKRSLRPPDWKPAPPRQRLGPICRAARPSRIPKPDRTHRAQIYWAAYRAGQEAKREAEDS